MKTIVGLIISFLTSLTITAQGLIKQQITTSLENTSITCGSFDWMKNVNRFDNKFLESSNALLEQIQKTVKNKHFEKSADDVYTIPVVFHIVYHNDAANLHDSIIYNQIQILNDAYRRTNADTINLREDFVDLAGDSKIEFQLAAIDPEGNPTTGIIRTQSAVEYFGGILPYTQNETQQIQQWVEDSLFYNYFRITQDSLGGSNAWDENRYLNIWIGDLRILEPKIGNFKEHVYFAFATAPYSHPNWPQEFQELIAPFSQGVLIDYLTIGNNNPNNFIAPYTFYNSKVKEGKILVHEIGHYLGLRHIWGDDSDCSVGDFIDDTPNATGESQWDCNVNKNSCEDDINGEDLPDMVENYMDYSSNGCQNSFTKGQIAVMRAVLENHRPDLAIKNTAGIQGYDVLYKSVKVYPNPVTDWCYIENVKEGFLLSGKLRVFNSLGKEVAIPQILSNKTAVNLEQLPKGVYFFKITNESEVITWKVIKD